MRMKGEGERRKAYEIGACQRKAGDLNLKNSQRYGEGVGGKRKNNENEIVIIHK